MSEVEKQIATTSHNMATVPLIRLQGISKVYRTDEVETTALSNINLDIESGDFIAIMGPSGCGKSTLLNILGMLDSPSNGNYLFKNEDVSFYPEGKLALIRKRNIGFIFQSFNLVGELSVFDNIELALLYHSIPASERRERVRKVMDQVGIAHRANHMPSQLSGGQQQRVAVARAVLAEPSIILADEPTGNLDSANGREVMRMLQALNADGTTIVMVTHSPAHADYARNRVNLLDGMITAQVQGSI